MIGSTSRVHTGVCRKLAITVKPLSYAACARARTDASACLSHTEPTKLTTVEKRLYK